LGDKIKKDEMSGTSSKRGKDENYIDLLNFSGATSREKAPKETYMSTGG
jgi:hypothetical protein